VAAPTDDRARWAPLLAAEPIRFPQIRFGLIGFDPATRARSVKASGRWLAEVIRDGVLDPARIP
jgi:beta-glucosidase/6-phospho-beta-glucosidase/beta-galactosidase